MKKFFLCLLLIGVVIGLIFSGCAKPAPTLTPTPTPTSTPTPAGAPIKIGALLHLTGVNALLGPPIKNGLEYRLDQVGWQVAGRKIELIAEDDATDPVVGVDKAKKLVLSDKVDVVVGPVQSAVAMAVANYMSKASIPNICLMPKPIDILKLGGNNIFSPLGTNEGTGYRAGLYAADKLGYKTCTTAFADYVSGYEFAGSAVEAFKKEGGTCIQEQPIKMGTNDYSPNIAAMKQADCVLFWFVPADAQRFATQYYTAGLKMPLVIANATVLFPQALTEIGDKAVGMVGCMFYSSLIDTPMNKSYVDGFIKKYKVLVLESLGADVALTMYLEAVKATGGDTSPAKINDALRKVKVETPAGTYSFTPEGLGIGDLYIAQVAKVGDGYNWKILDKYSQIVLDKPK